MWRLPRFQTCPESGGNCPYSYVPLERFATKRDFISRSPVEPPDQVYYMGALMGAGDSTVTIGRFLAEDGVLSQTPTVRVGNMATDTTARIRFSDRRRPSEQDCLLVESHSLPGYSGSAVYHFHPSNTWDGLDAHLGVPDHPLWRFLGIDCGHLTTQVESSGHLQPGWTPTMAIPGSPRTARVDSGMMTVVPAWTIREALEHEMSIYEPSESAVLDSVISSDVDSTADLMGKLLQVPKEEADEVHRRHRGK